MVTKVFFFSQKTTVFQQDSLNILKIKARFERAFLLGQFVETGLLFILLIYRLELFLHRISQFSH